jgi:hypothetical protein
MLFIDNNSTITATKMDYILTFSRILSMNGTEDDEDDQCVINRAESIRGFREHCTLAGHLKQMASKVMITPHKARLIAAGLREVAHTDEIFFFLFLGWFLLPLVELPLKMKQHKQQQNESNHEQDSANTREQQSKEREQYQNSMGYCIAHHIAQMSKLAFAVYMVDILKIVLQGMGFEFEHDGELPHAFANVLYTGWIVNRLSASKRYILAKQTNSDPGNLRGQVQLVDRLMDAFLYSVGLFSIVESVQEDMGAAAKGFLALSSVGTLIVSLASQGLAAQVFNGLFLASSNRIAVGDFVKFANGVSGTVVKLGRFVFSTAYFI